MGVDVSGGCIHSFFDAAFSFFFLTAERKTETKRKTAGCTFLAIPSAVSAKQKELASLKQLFVFNAPTTSSISRQKR